VRVASGDKAALPSQAAVRIGPFYFFFLLPRPDAELEGIARANTAAVADANRKQRAAVRQAISDAIRDYRDPLGYASIQDFMKLVHELTRGSEVKDSDDQLRKVLHAQLRKAGSGWEMVRYYYCLLVLRLGVGCAHHCPRHTNCRWSWIACRRTLCARLRHATRAAPPRGSGASRAPASRSQRSGRRRGGGQRRAAAAAAAAVAAAQQRVAPAA